MNVLTYNEAKGLFSQTLPPDVGSFFEKMADVEQSVLVDMDIKMKFRFITKKGNEVEYEIDTPEATQHVINIVRGIQYVPANIKTELSPYKTRIYYKPSKYVLPQN